MNKLKTEMHAYLQFQMMNKFENSNACLPTVSDDEQI